MENKWKTSRTQYPHFTYSPGGSLTKPFRIQSALAPLAPPSHGSVWRSAVLTQHRCLCSSMIIAHSTALLWEDLSVCENESQWEITGILWIFSQKWQLLQHNYFISPPGSRPIFTDFSSHLLEEGNKAIDLVLRWSTRDHPSLAVPQKNRSKSVGLNDLKNALPTMQLDLEALEG